MYEVTKYYYYVDNVQLLATSNYSVNTEKAFVTDDLRHAYSAKLFYILYYRLYFHIRLYTNLYDECDMLSTSFAIVSLHVYSEGSSTILYKVEVFIVLYIFCLFDCNLIIRRPLK